MARYIDADALLNNLPDDLPYKASVKRVLTQAPAADVVPKSEIERWRLQLEAVLDEIPETKREVAREIFEEIEKIACVYKLDGDFYLDNGIYTELKKKYTKQCPDCKHFVGCEEAVWSGRCEDFDFVRKEDEAYEKGYNDALKDVEEMILERKNENTSKG